jgi:periplasmic protein TonB
VTALALDSLVARFDLDPALARRLAIGLAVSIALHGALLAIDGRTPGNPHGTARGSKAVAARVMRAPSPAPAPQVAPQVAPVPAPAPAPTPKPAPQTRPAPALAPSAADPLPPPSPAAAPNASPPEAVALGSYYFRSSELDVRAQPLGAIDPEYPSSAGLAEGYLVLQLLINERGTVDEVVILVSDPEGVFDESARKAFGDARFEPAERNGIPVKSEMVVEVKYQPPIPTLALPPGMPALGSGPSVLSLPPGTVMPVPIPR